MAERKIGVGYRFQTAHLFRSFLLILQPYRAIQISNLEETICKIMITTNTFTTMGYWSIARWAGSLKVLRFIYSHSCCTFPSIAAFGAAVARLNFALYFFSDLYYKLHNFSTFAPLCACVTYYTLLSSRQCCRNSPPPRIVSIYCIYTVDVSMNFLSGGTSTTYLLRIIRYSLRC